MAQPYLSIVVPAYNEAERIPQALVDMDKRLSGVDYSYEILVVNDGSKDATATVVKNMAKMVRNLKLIDLKDNAGKGGAVKQGMLLATGKIRIFTDADNSTSIDQFENMMPLFKNGADVVIGSRTAKGSKLDPPEVWYRQIPGKIGNLIFQIMLGLWGIWDTQCGFKAFTDEATERIFNMSKTSGWGFDVEILALAKRLGYKIEEIPVHWVNDTRSHVRASAYLKVLGETCTIRWRLWRGEYALKSK
jgi:glycosyltransferase involved in cell wall biosynthesis